MFQCKNLYDNKNAKKIAQLGGILVFEYERDLSVRPDSAVSAYYASEMNIRRRQVLIELKNNAYTVQAGAMQWTCGSVKMGSGVKGVGDFLGKALSAKMTKESTVKPEYSGSGLLMLEPTYRHILLLDVSGWNGGLVLEDGLFLACAGSVKQTVVARSSFSSAIAGGEGLFNLCLSGSGEVALESPVPMEELIEFELDNDEVRIDGNMAIAWSNTLKFTVERSSKSLLGSAVSGEGLVNVFRGSGRVLMAPVAR